MAEEKREVKPTCPCFFKSYEEQENARKDFLRKHGDNLPEDEIAKAVVKEVWDNWVEHCDCDKPNEIVAAAHYSKTDWYLCTIKGLAVSSKYREMGYGRKTTQDTVTKANENPDCLVLAADVAYDNIPSLRTLKRAGFETVGEFCWGKGEKPADILHMIRFKPTQDKTCLGP